MSQCLNDQLQKTGCYCLNQAPSNTYENLFMGDHTLALKSDTDEQLIIQLSFQQTVKLTEISLGLPNSPSCPATVKVFANHLNLSFSDATDVPPTQVLNLAPPESGPAVVIIPLQASKWQRVESLTLFVEDNHGDEVSSLYSLKVFGTPVHGTNVADIHCTG